MKTPSSKLFCETIQPPSWDNLTGFLLKDNVDVWRISIKDHLKSLPFFHSLLSPEEQDRVERYHQQKDKNRFTIGKGMLRVILSNYLGIAPNDIEFKKGFNKKPFVISPGNLQFNVSYSNNWSIIAVSSEAVGLDIEYINEGFTYQEVMENCFTPKEMDEIMSSPKPQDTFFKFWTRKEALLKATSWGLGDYLKDFSCLDGLQPILNRFDKNSDWQIRSFLMEKEYYISIATNKQKKFRYCHYNQSADLREDNEKKGFP